MDWSSGSSIRTFFGQACEKCCRNTWKEQKGAVTISMINTQAVKAVAANHPEIADPEMSELAIYNATIQCDDRLLAEYESEVSTYDS